MALEILHLLLLLLSLGTSGNPGRTWAEHQPQEVSLRSPGPRGQEGQAEEEHRMEGESFSVNCSYKPQEHENGWISWCKKQENGEECGVPDLETSRKFLLPNKECFSIYDHDSGILTITMSELRVNDSGVYECVIHEEHPERQKVLRRLHLMVSPVQTQRPIKGMQTTSEATTANSVTNRTPHPSINAVFYGLLLIKGLVFVGVLIVLWKQYPQSEYNQRINKLCETRMYVYYSVVRFKSETSFVKGSTVIFVSARLSTLHLQMTSWAEYQPLSETITHHLTTHGPDISQVLDPGYRPSPLNGGTL
ncbi:trem-like transcript 4 protein [Petaurus breviceps papuanus]|uniref:trem-like transcript 4 protein n=1 Tax=Petaurus breviceps papuanus TaxID=3040969 RepID=UPI0036DE8C16